MKDFVHLHVHSEYSLLDGYAATSSITKHAAELGMDSIALTDHGVMYGAVEFYDAAKKAGIKPIIGVEAYMAVGSCRSKESRIHGGKKRTAYHVLLLAKNIEGYRNLVKLTTRAYIDGFYSKPRIDHELLAEHKDGLIVTSACLAGEINQYLLDGQKKEAREIAAWHRDTLGAENYFLELQLHPQVGQLESLNDELVRIGKELGIPLVVANDAHYVRREDAEAHRLIKALGFNTTLKELCAKEPELDDSYYIKSGAEMWELFKRYGTEPLENTRRIADMCNLDLDFGRVALPRFEIPAGHDAASYLRQVCEEGLMRRFNGTPPPDHYMQRLEYELDVINQTGFPDYMLIVWDYVKFARLRGIPCLPRGSAGASLVLYSLGITDVDPVENKLLFERFLSPERLEMPDIDTDFADSRRQEVIEYIANKYGRESTAQIITYGTLGAKNALRDMGRVLDIPLSEVDRVAKLIPPLPVGVTIAQALERVPELKSIYDSDERMRDLLSKAQLIEGRMRNVGTHACGLVVSREPLDNTVPLQRTTRDENALMAAYEGPTLAKVGLLKMDILGLTNLSVVAEALNYIERSTGRRMELADIPLIEAPNPDGSSNGVTATFESLSRGETTNVFQFESAGMTRYLRELKPTRVEDLYAMVALYRPGPLEQIPTYIRNKNNPALITYLHPILKPILEDTYGVIVYQEQIMQLLQAIAGYSLGRAYIVLKAIGKKKRDLMAQEEPRFKEGCLKSGLTQAQADELWDLIQPFAGYSFNRPHSTLYGLLSYQTSYLKVNYPTEYMAAVLTAASGETESVAKSVTECSRLGVAVLPADINHSKQGFTIEEVNMQKSGARYPRGIRFGLAAIKNVGEGPVKSIIAAREEGGPFVSLEDVCLRVDRSVINKRVLESLIKSGTMDDLLGSRRQKLAVLDQVIAAAIETQKARDMGQSNMFDMFGGAAGNDSPGMPDIAFPTITETPDDKKESLAWEKELLGMYVSEHPVAQALQGVAMGDTLPLAALTDQHVGKMETFVGMLTGTRRISTKKGDPMLVAVLEDLESSIEVVAFPRTLSSYEEVLQDDNVVKVQAKVDDRRGAFQLILETCELVQFTATTASESAARQPEMDIEDMAALEEHAPAPAADAGKNSPLPTPELPASAAPATANAAPPSQSTPAPKPAPATSERFIRMPSRVSRPVNGNGNGANGQTNGNGSGHSNGSAYAAPPVEEQQYSGRKLLLHIPRTNDHAGDVRRMQATHDILSTSNGNDQVMIYVPNGSGTVVLRSDLTIAISPQLIQSLTEVLGTGRVQEA